MPAKQLTANEKVTHWHQVREQILSTLYRPLWERAWPVWAGALALAVANVFMFAYARGLGVFPQMAMWGSWVYNLLGIETESPFYPLAPPHLDLHSMVNFGLIMGVLMAALLSREFKVRTESWHGYLAGFSGGILMGLGTVLTPPCNVGGFYTATMALSLSGPLMALGLLPGAYVGGRLLRWQAERAAREVDFREAPAAGRAPASPRSRQPAAGILVLLLLVGVAAIYAVAGMPRFTGLLLFGAVFGVIFQRSRLCFAAAFREITVSRDPALMKWILVSLALGTIGFTILKGQGHLPAHMVFPAGLHTVLGGFIFGIGMTVAGGCGVGILWRSAEGYVRSWLALLGGMLAAGSWVHVYGHPVGKGWLYGPAVFLPDWLGWAGALAAVLLFVAVFYAVLTWVEVSRHETRRRENRCESLSG